MLGWRSGSCGWVVASAVDPELVGLDGEPGDADLLDEGVVGAEDLEELRGGGAALLGLADVEEEWGLEGEGGMGGPGPVLVGPADEEVAVWVEADGLWAGEGEDGGPGWDIGPSGLGIGVGGEDVYAGLLELPGPVAGAGAGF